MKVNVDKYYIVLINQLINMEKSKIISDKIKFTVVSKDDSDNFKYIDLLTNDIYKVSVGKLDRIGTMFINPNFTMIPVNAILIEKKQKISKSSLIKGLREYIIDLNSNLLEDKTYNDKKLIVKRGGVRNEKNIWIRF